MLFGKRLPAPPSIAEQYVGTDTELDPKVGAPQVGRTPSDRALRTEEATA